MSFTDDPYQSPQSGSPHQPAKWSSDFSDAAAHAAGADRGLIGHVPMIAMLMIAQGILELLFCTLGFGFLSIVYFGPQKDLGAFRGLGILMAAVSAPTLISGLLRIAAGIFNLRYRRRGLGIAALLFGLVTMMTGYCAPTAIALAVYGLVVYFNEPVMMAFRLGDSGRPMSEIRSAYLTRR
jgi:hypothetical protein